MTEQLQGRRGEPFRMVVEEGKIHEFAVATKSTHPDHHRDYDPVSPATFLMSMVFWQRPEHSVWAGIDRNWERVLHGEQEFVFFGPPPRARTELTGQARIERVYTKQGRRGGTMTFYDVVTEFRSADGTLVAQATATSLETSKPPSAE